jgi:uncharacterized protein (DUF1501 family)
VLIVLLPAIFSAAARRSRSNVVRGGGDDDNTVVGTAAAWVGVDSAELASSMFRPEAAAEATGGVAATAFGSRSERYT